MASKHYSSTVAIDVWKQHSCVECGSAYRYRLRRVLKGKGESPAAAEKAAEKAGLRAMERDVDQQPCPECGLYQPEMAADRRTALHWWVLAIFAPLMVGGCVLTWADHVSNAFGCYGLVGVGFGGLLCHLLVDSVNPNRDRDANRKLAQARRESGEIVLTQGSAGADGFSPPAESTLGAMVLFLLLAAAAVAPAAGEIMRLVNGWPNNPEWRPPVVGPGDDSYVYFDNAPVTSIKGYWRATGSATVVNNGEVGLENPVLPVTSGRWKWGGSIEIANGESMTSTRSPWARVEIPERSKLAGKLLKLRINLIITYPELQDGHFAEKERACEQMAELQLGPAGSGASYRTAFLLGTIGGPLAMALLQLGVIRQSDRARRLARPTEIFAVQQPTGEAVVRV